MTLAPLGMPFGHAVASALPKAMFTIIERFLAQSTPDGILAREKGASGLLTLRRRSPEAPNVAKFSHDLFLLGLNYLRSPYRLSEYLGSDRERRCAFTCGEVGFLLLILIELEIAGCAVPAATKQHHLLPQTRLYSEGYVSAIVRKALLVAERMGPYVARAAKLRRSSGEFGL